MVNQTSASSQAATRHGTYGLAIEGLESGVLAPVPGDWPLLRVERAGPPDVPGAAPGTVRVHGDRAEMWLTGGDLVEVRREPLTVRVRMRAAVADDLLLHPYLGIPAAIAARWTGRHSLHGGAFVRDGRAWALLGGIGAGKSSTLAGLLSAGHAVLSDDVLIVEGTTAFRGPRAIDLRADAATALGGEAIGHVGSRERWRLRAPEAPDAVPLGGLVHLDWGERLRLVALGARERLEGAIRHSVLQPDAAAGPALLELAALPAWRLERPRGIASLDAVVAQLLAL